MGLQIGELHNEDFFTPGMKARIIQCDNFPCLIGKVVTVCGFQDCPGKVRVSFDNQWQGYFLPSQLNPFTIDQCAVFLYASLKDCAGALAEILQLIVSGQDLPDTLIAMAQDEVDNAAETLKKARGEA